MFDWDDLRVFLAAARGRSLAAAALRLGMDATTVGRRIQRLETALGATLFVRSARGLGLTSAGARLHQSAVSIEAAVEAAHEGDARGPSGTVRLSASEAFGTQILAPALPAFLADKPGLAVELAADAGFLSPSTREVDITVTLTPVQSARLTVERLTDYALGLYASPDYLERAGRPASTDDLSRHRLIGYIDDLLYAPELRYLDEIRPGLRPHMASSSIRAQASMAAGGGGVVVLPVFTGALEPGLERILKEEVNLIRTFWIMVHNELRSAQRIRTVYRWLFDIAARKGPALLG